MKVLVVDDNPINRKILTKFLEEHAKTIEIAENGREAVDAVIDAHQRDVPFDLILLDIMMPVLDGLEALREIREFERRLDIEPNSVTVVMVSALGESHYVETALGLGCERYLTKPVDRRQLKATLVELGFTGNAVD